VRRGGGVGERACESSEALERKKESGREKFSVAILVISRSDHRRLFKIASLV